MGGKRDYFKFIECVAVASHRSGTSELKWKGKLVTLAAILSQEDDEDDDDDD